MDTMLDTVPPQFGRLLQERSTVNDAKALVEARLALKAITNHRKKYNPTSKPQVSGLSKKSENTPTSLPLVNLPLKELFDDTGAWQKKMEEENGAKRFPWSGFGFPEDETLKVRDFENKTYNDAKTQSVLELAQDLHDIRTKPATEIADSKIVVTSSSNNRTIHTFKLNGRTVTKVEFSDANIKKGQYNTTKTAKEFEKKVDKIFEDPAVKEFEETVDKSMSKRDLNKLLASIKKVAISQPDLDIERYVTAHILLRAAGKVSPILLDQIILSLEILPNNL
jgi:hypothetical protein